MEMSRLTRDGVTEPVSRDQILRREGGQGNIHFPCSADHERDWQPYPVDPSLSAGASIYLLSTANRLRGSVPSLSGHASAYRWRSLAGVRRHTVPLVLKVVPVTGASFQVSPCVFSSHPFWTSSSFDVPAGVTQEEGHTGFFIHLPSAVRALIFVARRIQPFLSLVDREVEFCVLTN